ncbi:MAG: DUF2182 domain-containing protein [Labilithrix sp.]|nr:DUF2182 domain-containing protein [Labilithrix sp.]
MCAAAWLGMLAHFVVRSVQPHDRRPSLAGDVTQFMLMTTAMMLPTIVGFVRVTAFRSMAHRRHRSVALFVLGYFVPWLGVALVVLALRFAPVARSGVAVATSFALAAIWFVTPWRARLVVACHRTLPLVPLGWRADLSALRYGLLVGGPCTLACSALMVACALSDHHPLALAGGAVLVWLERSSFRPRPKRVGAAALVVAAYFGAAAL